MIHRDQAAGLRPVCPPAGLGLLPGAGFALLCVVSATGCPPALRRIDGHPLPPCGLFCGLRFCMLNGLASAEAARP